jgi:hypothetical protein
LNSILNYIQQDTYKFLNHTPPAQGGNLRSCWQEIMMTLQGVQADLAPGDGLLPAEDNLFPMGRKLLPGGDL